MTAYTDKQDFLDQIKSPGSRVHDNRATITTLTGRQFSSWRQTGATLGTGAIPSTAAVPTRLSAGAIGQPDSLNELKLAVAQISRNAPASLILCDRLSHQGGLSGTATGAQTTNLPTAALTRYTSGEGVFAALEIYTAIGGTATTFTVSYTNQAGTSGRTSEVSNIGGANYQTASRMLIVPLQKGDSGVREVASVTNAATTGTVGNFGVTLFKPLVHIPFVNFANGRIEFNSMFNLGGQCQEILPDACLFWVWTASGTFGGQLISDLIFTDA